MAAPVLEPRQPLVAVLDGPQRRGVQVVGNKDIEPAVAGRVNQPFLRQILQLMQALDFRFPGDEAVAQELLDDLAIGAFFGAAAHRFQHAAGQGMVGGQILDGAEIRQLGKGRIDQALPPGLHYLPLVAVAEAAHFFEIGFPLPGRIGQQQVAQGGNDVLGFPLDDHIEVAQRKGFLRQRPHLRPAADGNQPGMELLGQAGNLIGPGRFVNQGRYQQNVDAGQVLVRVEEAAAVFEPDLAVVEEGAVLLLPQGGGEEKHPLAGDSHILEVAAGRGRLNHDYPFNLGHRSYHCATWPGAAAVPALLAE